MSTRRIASGSREVELKPLTCLENTVIHDLIAAIKEVMRVWKRRVALRHRRADPNIPF